MREKSILSLFIMALLLTGCAGLTATPPVVVTENPFIPAPITPAPTAYPAPVFNNLESTLASYPAPGTPSAGNLLISLPGYEPQPGDVNLTREDVNLDLNFSQLITLADYAGEVAITLQGNLPDPCHQLRIILTPADSANKINIEVYSVYDQSMMCTLVIVPFEVTVPLGVNLSGHYSVYVNGQLFGEFDK